MLTSEKQKTEQVSRVLKAQGAR